MITESVFLFLFSLRDNVAAQALSGQETLSQAMAHYRRNNVESQGPSLDRRA
jgi:hypothetical protein